MVIVGDNIFDLKPEAIRNVKRMRAGQQPVVSVEGETSPHKSCHWRPAAADPTNLRKGDDFSSIP
jgi:hypothetical protein